MGRWKRVVTVVPSVIALVMVAGAAQLVAQGDDPPAAANPCEYRKLTDKEFGGAPFENPTDIESQDGVLSTTLNVEYTDPETTKIAGCGVHLRSYNGAVVGPTLRVHPGDTMSIKLANQLPAPTAGDVTTQAGHETDSAHLTVEPVDYNTTNLHTHGLHVSPEGNSDNVLLHLAPQTEFDYEITIPEDHPAGTYWYHAHAHGSTAVQVGSGMAGAIVIEDDETKIPAALAAANENEQVLVFSAIPYDTKGEVENIQMFFPDDGSTPCSPDAATCTLHRSQRRNLVNGQIAPTITMSPGEVARWRLVDATFNESLRLKLEGHTLHEIALDGIYSGQVDDWTDKQTVDLEPGYRSDVLVQASDEPGTYLLTDEATTPALSSRGVDEEREVIAKVVVKGKPGKGNLITDEEATALDPYPGVDLAAQQGTFGGVDLATEKKAKVPIGKQISQFSIHLDGSASGQVYFQVNGAAFDPANVRNVALNTTDEWSLSTVGDPPGTKGGIQAVPHIFHIHVNPFQTVRTGADGKQQTVWKDTLRVNPGAPVNIYTRYLDFTGSFVMHCHLLDHEDLGMMQVVRVVDSLPLPIDDAEPAPDSQTEG